jgi:hypothetical protein
MDFTIKKQNKMKTFAHHDPEGNIKSLIVINAPGNIGLMLTPRPGISVTEVEGIKFKSKSPSNEELQAIVKDFKLTGSGSKGRVERKTK